MNMNGVNRFFRFCRARHEIFLRRESGQAREHWTDDAILQKFKFTNVFRELDRTTAWFRHFVRQPLRNKPEVMLATVLFRMFNRVEVGEAIFCQTVAGPVDAVPRLYDRVGTSGTKLGGQMAAVTPFEIYCATGNLRELRGYIKMSLPRGPYATGAYIISSPPGFSKLDGVLRVVDDFAKRKCANGHCGYEDWRCAAKRLLEEPKTRVMEHVWNWLREFDYLGKFHSYEVACDLRHTALLDDAVDVDSWCSPGPGARRGMNRVEGRGKDEGQLADDLMLSMRKLLSLSRETEFWPQPEGDALRVRGYDLFTHDRRSPYAQWPRWEMREVEHSLCEFDKYSRVRSGEGRPRGVYR